jgi:maltooligosyltrehalose trehalohydrolase
MPSITTTLSAPRVGTTRLPDGSWQFLLWAPHSASVSIHLKPVNQLIPMERLPRGYHRAVVENLPTRSRYLYRLGDGRDLPDPASRFQPEGVHGPSQLVDTSEFRWTDQNWRGRPLEGCIFYELHVGAFTPDGTFDALVPHLPQLVDLGITTIEIMPVAQFPGSRNWGYDGTYPFAPQNTYGGPDQLQRFVNAAHAHGLAVALDVVYNHLGPEGNYLSAFGPYFTDRYRTPWGQAINFDGQGSDEVRRFFGENALYWLEEYHFDALRLDAVHGIFDFSALHFLAELKSSVADLSSRLGRNIHLIAESDLNDSRLLRDSARGGYSLDGQWSDDFHHSVHTLLTREDRGYYEDFGGMPPLAASLRDGWYYRGQYSPHRRCRHGNSPQGIPPHKFVVCNQNHDQVGNRAAGERLTRLVNFEALKLAAGITLLSPFTPLLFMGEEYAELAPFQYFTSHGDPALVEAVRRGRREEFAAFGWQDSVPDPQDEQTFLCSRLNLGLNWQEPHATLLRFYRHLIRMRAQLALATAKSHAVSELGDAQLLLTYDSNQRDVAMIFNFAEFPVTLLGPALKGKWSILMDSAAESWQGPESDSRQAVSEVGELRLAPSSFLVLEKESSPEAS